MVSRKTREFPGFSHISFENPGFFGFLQVTIFGLKSYPRGSGAWKQPQQSISKAGLHRIPRFLWAGSLPDVDIPWPSQPSQSYTRTHTHTHTHTHPPPPLENFEYSEYSGDSGGLGTSESSEFPDYSEISEHSECSECSEHAENCISISCTRSR